MNPVLVESIRVRMGGQSTEELLALWTTNDRAMWSAEAFEAVKSLLAERGVRPLPPQNDPAPVARKHLPGRDPGSLYWLGWLRPVLWICVGVGGAGVPYALFLLGSLAVTALQKQLPVYNLWRGTSDAMFWIDQVLYHIVMPVWLLVAALACLRLKPWSRPLLLWYSATAVVVALSAAVLQVVQPQLRVYAGPWVLMIPVTLASLAQNLVLPAVLWMLLRRPEIAWMFVTTTPGRAFQALPAAAPEPTAS